MPGGDIDGHLRLFLGCILLFHRTRLLRNCFAARAVATLFGGFYFNETPHSGCAVFIHASPQYPLCQGAYDAKIHQLLAEKEYVP